MASSMRLPQVRLMSVWPSLNDDMRCCARRWRSTVPTCLHLNNAKGIKEALIYCVPQLNGSNTVAGFSPAQWVLGYQPQLAGSLLSDTFKPVHNLAATKTSN